MLALVLLLLPIAKPVKTYTLLQNTTHQTARLLGQILEGGRGGVTIKTTHCNSEQGAAGEELLVRLAEAGPLFLSAIVPRPFGEYHGYCGEGGSSSPHMHPSRRPDRQDGRLMRLVKSGLSRSLGRETAPTLTTHKS